MTSSSALADQLGRPETRRQHLDLPHGVATLGDALTAARLAPKTDRRLTPSDAHALLVLASRWPYIFPGVDRLADEMGVTHRSAERRLARLTELGYLTTTRRGDGQTALRHLNFRPDASVVSERPDPTRASPPDPTLASPKGEEEGEGYGGTTLSASAAPTAPPDGFPRITLAEALADVAALEASGERIG